MDPAPVKDVEPELAAENVTLTWPRPEGRVDSYYVKWYRLSNTEDIRTKTVAGDSPEEDRRVRVLVPGLHPGVDYMFEMTTEAHDLRSETVRLSVRTMPLITSELATLNRADVTNAITVTYSPTPFNTSFFDTYRLVYPSFL
jgi:receptor-type tyrosine-protein phosphatase beta